MKDTHYVLEEIAGKDVALQKTVKKRMQEKCNYALSRLCLGKTYPEFKLDYQRISEIYPFEKYDFSQSCESTANKLRLYLLNKKHLHWYYCFNKFTNWMR